MKLPKVKVPRIRKPRVVMPAPHRPKLDNGDEPELLRGEVQGLEASAPEERYTDALSEKGIAFEFRPTLGAPRGMPGWFELDVLAYRDGLYYPIEIDTEFTHRQKGRADVLHDARVLSELEREGIPHFPQVFHIAGDADLVDKRGAKRVVQELFG